MADGRRGRISHEVYAATVGRMLTRDWFALDTCDVLTQLEVVTRLVEAYSNRYLTRGAAVRFVLDKAIALVIAACGTSSDLSTRRVSAYLVARQEGKTVSAIAREWRLSREYVSRVVGHRAVEL